MTVAVLHRPQRLWLTLVALAAIGFIGAIPYFLQLFGHLPIKAPLPLVLLGQGGQVTVLCALAAWAGVKLAPRVGLDAPYLRGESTATLPRVAAEALLVGTIAAALTLAALLAVKPFAP